MSDVIDVLERIGQDAQWCQASQGDLLLALAAAEIAPELQAAIVAGDSVSLQALLGISPLCAMFTPAEDDEAFDEGQQDEGNEQLPPDEEVDVQCADMGWLE